MSILYKGIAIAVLIVSLIVLIILIHYNSVRPHQSDPAKFAITQGGYTAGFYIFGALLFGSGVALKFIK